MKRVTLKDIAHICGVTHTGLGGFEQPSRQDHMCAAEKRVDLEHGTDSGISASYLRTLHDQEKYSRGGADVSQ